jgi:hypothetical protein
MLNNRNYRFIAGCVNARESCHHLLTMPRALWNPR